MHVTAATRDRLRARLMAWLELADVSDVLMGETWYRDARSFCEALSASYGVSYNQVAGVVAALSPSTRWDLNKRQAEALVRAYSEGGDLDGVTVSTYDRQAAKARAIIRGSDSRAVIRKALGVRAFKTQAFYDNLTNDQIDSVTVDRHIIAAAGFENEWVRAARWCYDLLTNVIRDIAVKRGERPHQTQAIIWVTYKRLAEAYSPEEKVTPF